MSLSPKVLEMREITKSFAGVTALSGVDLTLEGGQIHALLGANGAGKSTLMKILSGAYGRDGGSMKLLGREVRFQGPSDAKLYGVHCVYQEVDAALVPQLTVAENVMLDELAKPGAKTWLSPGETARRAEAVLERLKVSIPVKRKVAELSIAEKQMILLARILSQDAKVIIFDEPTAPLSGAEAESFFRILHELKDQGVACVFITHRLQEVMDHADRVTVMRDGRVVYSGPLGDAGGIDGLISHMLGKTFAEEFPKVPAEIGDVLLRVNGLKRGTKVRGVDLEVRRGQIVAVVGLVGAGKSELARLLAGADRPDAGTIELKGRTFRFRQPADAVRAGIVSIPEERRKQGIVIQDSVERNLSLPLLGQLSRLGVMSARRERNLAERVITALGIKTSSPKLEVKYLSGGNQQKVAIGKWLERGAEVLVFDEPTKGVDIGAKSDIFRIIGNLAAQGKGIVYFTSELDEGLGIGDQIAVMVDGRIAGVFDRGEITQEQALFYASGGRREQLS